MELFKLLGTIAVSNDDANKALDETTTKAKTTKETIDKIRSGAVRLGTAFTGFAGVVGGAFMSSVESTRQYREQMNMLTTAFTSSGHSVEAAKQTYSGLNAVLGDTGQAVEAANHIAKLASNTQDMKTWAEICTGVWATFGESLPIEGLTEAANETAKVGQVVGPLADALNWMGVSEDAFNEKLKGMTSEQERQQLIMETLNGLYKEASEEYKESNKDIMAAYEAQDKMTASIANFGAVGEPVLTTMQTKLSEIIDGAFKWITENGESVGVALSVIATGIAAGAIAAHPYAAAITAVAAAIAFLNSEEGKRRQRYDHFFDQYTDEDLQTLQAYVDAVNETRRLYEELEKNPFDENAGARLQAAETAKEAALNEVTAIEGLLNAYNSWRSGQAENQGKDLYLDVPLRVADGSETEIQSELGGMSLEAVVKLIPDASQLSSVYSIASGGSPKINWNADGAIFSKPTIFNTPLGLQGVGDGRSPEAVAPIDKLQGYIRDAVRETVGGMQFNIVLDSGALIGQLAPGFDRQLGTIASRKGR